MDTGNDYIERFKQILHANYQIEKKRNEELEIQIANYETEKKYREELEKKHGKDFVAKLPILKRPLSRNRRRVPLDHPPTYRYLMMRMGFSDEEINQLVFRDESYPERVVDDFYNENGIEYSVKEMLQYIVYDTEQPDED